MFGVIAGDGTERATGLSCRRKLSYNFGIRVKGTLVFLVTAKPAQVAFFESVHLH